MTRTPIPVRPANPEQPEEHVFRAAFAAMHAQHLKARFEADKLRAAAALFSPDSPAYGLTRAATTGAVMSDSAWAGNLVGESVLAFFGSLAPFSAIAAIMPQGMTFLLDQARWDEALIPTRAGGPRALPWVGQGNAIPVRQETTSQVQLGPAKKVGGIMVMSRRMAAAPNAYDAFKVMLQEDCGATLDAAYLSTAAADSETHAGLLYGVSALTPTGELDPQAAVIDDLAALASAVSGKGASGRVAYIASPGRAAVLAVRAPAAVVPNIYPSQSVADGDLVAVDPASLAHGFGSIPEFDGVNAATVHMSDDPDPIVDGSGNVAAPVRSLWQTDMVGVRSLLPIAFAKRRAGAAAVIRDIATW